MSIIFLLISLLFAFAGIWLLFDFLLWYFTGYVTRAVIEDFVSSKSGYGQLPVLRFELEDGAVVTQKAERVCQMMYLLGQPEIGTSFEIIYRHQNPVQVRVHGYLYLLLSALCFLPLLFALAYKYGNGVMAGQVSFVVVFAVIALGGWILLKTIQKS